MGFTGVKFSPWRAISKSLHLFHLPQPKGLEKNSLNFIFPTKYVNIAPEKWWLEDDPFLLGFGNFSGANC